MAVFAQCATSYVPLLLKSHAAPDASTAPSFSKQFLANGSGGITAVFGIIALALFVAAGAAIDICRWYDTRAKTLAALDAAVLAAGRRLQLDSSDVAGALTTAENFYRQNTRELQPLLDDTFTFRVEDSNTAVGVSGSAYIKTTFLQLANVEKLPLFTLAGDEYAKAVLAVGTHSGVDLEIALMIDTSTAMKGQKLDELKNAAARFVDIVVWADQSAKTSRVSLVPFSGEVRVPGGALDAVRGINRPGFVTLAHTCGAVPCNTNYVLSSCVVERAGAGKYTDASPEPGNYVLAQYTLNGTCAQPSANENVPLSGDKDGLKTKIGALRAAGGSAGQLGTAWVWYTLSANWNSIWPDSGSGASANGSTSTKKIAILMLGSDNNTAADSNGVKVGSMGAGPAANGTSGNQTEALCEAMKLQDITIYAIGFDLAGREPVRQTLAECASETGKFYEVANGSELNQAYIDIALKLSQLYLSQ